MFSKYAFKEAPENYTYNFPAAGILCLVLLPFSIAIFWNYYLKRPLRNGDLNVCIDCWVRGECQKIHMGNCIKALSVRRVDCVVDWNSVSCEKVIFASHNWLRQNAADKHTFITDGMANFQVLEGEKTYLAVGYYKV